MNFTNGDSQAWYTEGVGAWVGSSCVSSWTAAFNISLSSGSCISASSAALSTATYSKFLGQSDAERGREPERQAGRVREREQQGVV